MPEWQADVVVDEDDVRGLIAAQFPSLALRGLRRLAEGGRRSCAATCTSGICSSTARAG